ncbi:MAG: hypothetical protein RLZZ290_765 [Pseudomonadota bacterium]
MDLLTIDAAWTGLSLVGMLSILVGLFFGGLCKGVTGLGLPLIVVPIASLFVPVPKALSLLSVAVVVTNVVQLRSSGQAIAAVKRFGLLTSVLVLAIVFGTGLLVSLHPAVLIVLMGLVMLVYPLTRMIGRQTPFTPLQERVLGPPIAAVSGVLGGMTGFFGPPLLVFFAIQRLEKQFYIGTVALIFLSGYLALSASLASHGALSQADLLVSALALIPILLGLRLGEGIRQRISQKGFERVLLGLLTVMGASLVWRGIHQCGGLACLA